MAIELRQQLKLSQQLVMTPQLQMAIRLLQLNRLELAEQINQELLENPCLEEAADERTADELKEAEAASPYEEGGAAEAPNPFSEGDRGPGDSQPGTALTGREGEGATDFDWQTYFESYNLDTPHPRTSSPLDDETLEFLQSSVTRPETLAEHLLWQVRMGQFSEEERRIAAFIAGNLNEDGYLDAAAEDICQTCGCTPEEAERVRHAVQLLDPPGVASRGVKECLLAQLEHAELEGELPWVILTEHQELLEKRNYKQIARKTRRPISDVMRAVEYLASLEPKPARAFPESETQYVVPDIYVHKVGEEYVVSVNDDGLPRLRLNPLYRKALYEGGSNGAGGAAAKDYIQEKMKSALWLIKSIHQRQRTIYRVMEAILKYQREFFDYGIEYLKPMVLRDVAEEISMHESTVSRVTSNKYVHTPRGIFPLKYFFNSGISTTSGGSVASESVKDKIRRLVASEPPQSPYTDLQFVELLHRQGIDISRRTVTKYREAMDIDSSSRRRRGA